MSTADPQQRTPESYATIGARIGAYLLDSVFSFVAVLVGILLSIVFGLVIGSVSVTAGFVTFVVWYTLAGLGYALYVWYLTATKGYSPGKRVVGLRLVDAETLQPIGWGRTFLRGLVLGLIITITLGVGAIVVAVLAHGHPRRQGWHDLAVKSVVMPRSAWDAAASGTSADADFEREHLATSASAPPAPPPPVSSLGPVAAVAPPPVPAPSPTPVLPTVPHPSPSPQDSLLVAPPPDMVASPPMTDDHVAESVDESTRAVKARGRTWRLRDTSGPLELRGSILAGRDPDPTLVQGAVEWKIDDPERTVSKTHALFGLEDGQPFVEDWASTNGVVLRRDGSETDLPARERTALQAGDELMLGEHVIRVEDGT